MPTAFVVLSWRQQLLPYSKQQQEQQELTRDRRKAISVWPVDCHIFEYFISPWPP